MHAQSIPGHFSPPKQPGYKAMCVHIRVPGEPENEATSSVYQSEH